MTMYSGDEFYDDDVTSGPLGCDDDDMFDDDLSGELVTVHTIQPGKEG